MKKRTFATVALVCCFVALLAVAADISGKWSGTITIPDASQLAVTYNFKVDGDKVTGTAESPNGTVSVDNGMIKGDSLMFKVNVDGTDYPHAGRIYADSIGMDLLFGGAKTHFTLKRATN